MIHHMYTVPLSEKYFGKKKRYIFSTAKVKNDAKREATEEEGINASKRAAREPSGQKQIPLHLLKGNVWWWKINEEDNLVFISLKQEAETKTKNVVPKTAAYKKKRREGSTKSKCLKWDQVCVK